MHITCGQQRLLLQWMGKNLLMISSKRISGLTNYTNV